MTVLTSACYVLNELFVVSLNNNEKDRRYIRIKYPD